MLPSGDFYLCHGCYDRAIDFVGDPTIHHWETVHVEIAGLSADATYVVERCRICGDLRVDEGAKVVEWVPEKRSLDPVADTDVEDGRREPKSEPESGPEGVVQEPCHTSSPRTDP